MTPRLDGWGWAHRLWHWLLAIALVVSSYTGFVGGIELMDWHVRSGACIIALLLFRLGWACWGDPAVRVPRYRTSAVKIWRQLRNGVVDPDNPHTAAGAAMAIALTTFASVQAGSGLFASDDISTDGPFAGRVGHAGVEIANAIHTRVYWVIWALAAVHIVAIGWYRWRGDPIASSMGIATAHAAPRQNWWRAALTLGAALVVVWIGVRWAS
jgi:cytochrome b